MKFILASQNAHKAQEFAAAIQSIVVETAPHGMEVDENADSFVGNATSKARAYSAEFGVNAVADDSGLCVDALNGAPGVHSQRYAILPPDIDDDSDRTAANNRKLLRALAGVPESGRGAHFACALCLVVVDAADIEVIRRLAPKACDWDIHFYDNRGREIRREDEGICRAELTIEKHAHGHILNEQHGKGGFGYDPLFYCPEAQCTFAELTREQKLSVSHRGKAIAALCELFSGI